MLKSLYIKNKNTIKNIIKKLPFTGEGWMQEFIREEWHENYKLDEDETYNNNLEE
jgi:hypothetical protein